MKRCFRCGERKALGEFYRHPMMADGHLGKCKACTKEDVRLNYRARWESKVAYDAQRTRTAERRAAKAKVDRRHRQRHPDRSRARTAVHVAVRDGWLVRKPCQRCGATSNIEGHHMGDYRHPLRVTWLCRDCGFEAQGKWSYNRRKEQRQ